MSLFVLMVVLSPFTAVIPGIYGIYLMLKKKISFQKNYLNIGLILLFLSYLISGLINKSILSISGTFLLLVYLGVSVLSQSYFTSNERIENMFKMLIYYSVVTAMIGIGEKILFIFIGKPTHRIFSTYGNPNMTAAWFASIILICIFMKYKIDKDDKKLNFLLIPITIALLLTESTGAFIAILVSIATYLLVDRNRDFKKNSLMTITIFLVGITFILAQRKINSITVVDEVKTSFTSRYDIWIGSIEMFLLKPFFGWGSLGTLEHGIDFMYNNGNVIHSHNVWLTFLVSGGIVALLIYLFIKFKIIGDLIKIYLKGDKYICILVSLNVMVVIQGLVDCSLYAPQLATLFIVTNSILINIVNGVIDENSKDKGVTDKRKAVEINYP